ncbi:MAG: hypothetical protein WKF84_02495 [Pyrinomonadaceae bacterium]
MIIEARGHIYNYEMAAMSVVAGVLARPVKSEGGSGILTWPEIEGALHAGGPYYKSLLTGLIAPRKILDNLAGGTLHTPERTEEICQHSPRAEYPCASRRCAHL